jgi:hypothetical protein
LFLKQKLKVSRTCCGKSPETNHINSILISNFMKTILKALVLCAVVVSSLSFSTSKQTKVTVTAVYDGLEEYGYNFIVSKDGMEHTLTFQDINETLLKTYDLTTSEFVGKTFKVTYTIDTETMVDEFDNEEEIETLIIVGLEKL